MAKIERVSKNICLAKCVYTSVWTTQALGAYLEVDTFYPPSHICSDSQPQPGRAGPVELDMTIALATLLPADTRHYYHYQVLAEIYSLQRILFVLYQDLPQPQGGLTTPTCNEAVLWTNFMATQSISEAQLAIFRSMTDSEEVAIVDNYRPPQPLNARTLYTTGVRKITL